MLCNLQEENHRLGSNKNGTRDGFRGNLEIRKQSSMRFGRAASPSAQCQIEELDENPCSEIPTGSVPLSCNPYARADIPHHLTNPWSLLESPYAQANAIEAAPPLRSLNEVPGEPDARGQHPSAVINSLARLDLKAAARRSTRGKIWLGRIWRLAEMRAQQAVTRQSMALPLRRFEIWSRRPFAAENAPRTTEINSASWRCGTIKLPAASLSAAPKTLHGRLQRC